MQILVLLGMYFDAVVVFVTNYLLVFRFAMAILWYILSYSPLLVCYFQGPSMYLFNESLIFAEETGKKSSDYYY